MTALTGEELIAWVEKTTEDWKGLIQAHPEIWAMPCDVASAGTVAVLLQHMVAVELRYAQRLEGVPESPYSEVLFDTPERLFAFHDCAMVMVGSLVADKETDWDRQIEFQTISAGRLRASRKAVLIHMLMHSIRHYAQLQTLVRQHGIKPDFPGDYLFMDATRA